MRLYRATLSAIRCKHGADTLFLFRAPIPSLIIGASTRHLGRILVGLLSGTTGFAPSNSVGLAITVSGRRRRLRLSISSANYNVPPSGDRGMFRHFRGLGRCSRNAKLKLTVDELVVRGLKNGV